MWTYCFLHREVVKKNLYVRLPPGLALVVRGVFAIIRVIQLIQIAIFLVEPIVVGAVGRASMCVIIYTQNIWIQPRQFFNGAFRLESKVRIEKKASMRRIQH